MLNGGRIINLESDPMEQNMDTLLPKWREAWNRIKPGYT